MVRVRKEVSVRPAPWGKESVDTFQWDEVSDTEVVPEKKKIHWRKRFFQTLKYDFQLDYWTSNENK